MHVPLLAALPGHPLVASDGLRLVLDNRGRVARVRAGRHRLSPADRAVTVRLDDRLVAAGKVTSATELVTGERAPVASGSPLRFPLRAPAGAVVVVALDRGKTREAPR